MLARLLVAALLSATLVLPAGAASGRMSLPDSSASLRLTLATELAQAPLPHGQLVPPVVEEVEANTDVRAPASAYWAFALGMGIGIFLTLALFAPDLSFGLRRTEDE